MADKLSPIVRICILALFGATLLGLVGHQLLLVSCTEVSTARASSCTPDNRSGQPSSPDAAGCPVHTGYLAPTTAAIRFSPLPTQDVKHSDSTTPFLLAFPVLHPPA